MTTTLPEVQQEQTPAEQAMVVAVAFAVAAEASVEQAVRAWLAGRFSRIDLCYHAAQMILQGVAKATLAGEHLAEQEWNYPVRPRVIPAADHKRLTFAVDKITREGQKARAVDLLKVLQAPQSQPDAQPPEVVMRSKRLAQAEVIRAGRTAYAEATSQAIAGDPDFIWRFTTDSNPCGRCIALAARTFDSFEQAPSQGGHVGCACILQAELREG